MINGVLHISYVLNKPRLARKMGEEGRMQILSWKDIARKTVKLYRFLS